jgi:hypothetical protein
MLVLFLRLPTDIQNKLRGEVSEFFFNSITAYDSKVFVLLSALFPMIYYEPYVFLYYNL